MGLGLIEVSISQSDTSHSVRLLWTSDRPIAGTSTWQHTALTRQTSTARRYRSHNPSKRVAAEPRLRPSGNWYRLKVAYCKGKHRSFINPLNPELNPIRYLLALLGAHHFLYVSRIRVKLLTFRLLMSYIYIYGAPILDVSRSHTTTQHSR